MAPLVRGWLATPPGTGPFPTVIEIHGGPHTVVTDAYHPVAQMLLDHGYAYLALNCGARVWQFAAAGVAERGTDLPGRAA
jgi:dipeptidyl aminopeptidase/acylaminoacyl peptidase